MCRYIDRNDAHDAPEITVMSANHPLGVGKLFFVHILIALVGKTGASA